MSEKDVILTEKQRQREVMRRKLFFILEKLEINRSERIAISLLLMMLMVTSLMFAIAEPKLNYDPEHYKELEQIFLERSQRVDSEREEILVRYRPVIAASGRDHVNDPEAVPRTDTESMQLNAVDPKRININRAGLDELQQLPGIGPAYAERIISWREENGEFTTVEQLLEIRGIGERRLEQIRPLIKLKDEDEG
ncbi:MAG: helix-hairpin-helix domain-containing protein [Balneolaceae bacterium]|nr:MAG: helix-hairpin-helix domain-containing protein [Balneolaceae bacterium]